MQPQENCRALFRHTPRTQKRTPLSKEGGLERATRVAEELDELLDMILNYNL